MQRRASMNEMLRPAAPADLPLILELLRQAGLVEAGVPEHLTTFTVAEDAGRVVGSAGLEVYGDVAVLRSVAVAPEHRGRGVGRRLVESALVEARHRGLREVALLTETAAPFFRRLGFQEVERAALDPRFAASAEFGEGSCATAVAMIKEERR